MTPLFAKNSLTLLESLSFTKTIYAFDFDGTLSKIVRVPDEAKVAPITESLISQLCKLVPVAIISGRSLEDLKKRVHFNPQFLIGNHGLEGLNANSVSLQQAEHTCRVWKSKLPKGLALAGVTIEDKIYSIAVHYRLSRKKQLARKKIQAAIANLTPAPRVIGGKSVFNLLPPGAPHKGLALLDLVQLADMKHIFYVGDDDTDEDVFGMPSDDRQIMTVRIGEKRNSHARYYLDRQSDINKLLRTLIRYHKHGAAV